MPEMPLELRVVHEEQDGVNDRNTVSEDVQNVLRVSEVQLFLAVVEVLNEPHDVVR